MTLDPASPFPPLFHWSHPLFSFSSSQSLVGGKYDTDSLSLVEKLKIVKKKKERKKKKKINVLQPSPDFHSCSPRETEASEEQHRARLGEELVEEDESKKGKNKPFATPPPNRVFLSLSPSLSLSLETMYQSQPQKMQEYRRQQAQQQVQEGRQREQQRQRKNRLDQEEAAIFDDLCRFIRHCSPPISDGSETCIRHCSPPFLVGFC